MGAVAYLGFPASGVIAGRIGLWHTSCKPVGRDAEMLSRHNMLDWVPEGHAVRVGCERGRAAHDGGAWPAGAAGPKGRRAAARYDPVMLLSRVDVRLWLRGVLSTPGGGGPVPLRCDVPGRVRAAGPGTRRSPGSASTCSRRRAWRRTCSTRFCTYARAQGWGGWAWWRANGVKIAANASKEASRTEAGLRELAGQVMAVARKAAATTRRTWRFCPALTCCWARTRCRAAGSAVAGRAGAGLPGGAWKASGRRPGPPPVSRGRPDLQAVAAGTAGRRDLGRGSAGRAAAAAGKARRRSSRPRSRPGKPPAQPAPPGRGSAARPADPQDTARVRRARARLADLRGRRGGRGRRGREAGRGRTPATQRHRPGLPAAAGPRAGSSRATTARTPRPMTG